MFPTLEELTNALTATRQKRGADCFVTVGLTQPITFAVWDRSEPHHIKAPINLKWLNKGIMYVRTSRSPANGFKNTWVRVTSLPKAMEPEVWDTIKPADWRTLQHETNISDPHESRGQFEGGTLTSPLELSPNQPTGDNYAASQKFVHDSIKASKYEYTGTAKAEHVINHGRNTMCPAVFVYVDNELVFADQTIVIDANRIRLVFPFPVSCKVAIV